MNKDQAYHQIALACLKTLRSTAADKQDSVTALHEAIDAAFQEQFALILAELEDQRTRLMLIENLNPEQHGLEDAQQIAARQTQPH